MSATDSASRKRLVRIGTLGDAGHGKTTLASAITAIQAERGLATAVSRAEILSLQRRSGGLARIRFDTEQRRYEIIDCAVHGDYVSGLLSGTAKMHGAVLVVSSDDGPTERTGAYLRLARRFGVHAPIVFINQRDTAPQSRFDELELEIRRVVSAAGYRDWSGSIVRGSALEALSLEPQGIEGIVRLLDLLDREVPEPPRGAAGGDFLMPIEDVYTIRGRGTVVTGRIERGSVTPGEEIELCGPRGRRRVTVDDVRALPKRDDPADEKDEFLLRVTELDWGDPGWVLSKPGTIDLEELEAALAESDAARGSDAAPGVFSLERGEPAAHRDGPLEKTRSGPVDKESARPADEEPASDAPGAPRFLTAGVTDVASGRAAKHRLIVGRDYELDVDIGPDGKDRFMDPQRPFAEHELPAGREQHTLRVVFVEPNHAPQPQQAWIRLPAKSGRSTSASFHFAARADCGDFEARIAIFHGCRVIQTALLTARVLDHDDQRSDVPIRLRVETLVRSDLSNTWSELQFQGSLILNRGVDGTPRALATTEDRSLLLSLEGAQEQLRNIKDRLTEVAYEPDAYEDLFGDKMLDLLRYLAFQGSTLYEQLVDADPENELFARRELTESDLRRTAIQIVATKNSSLLPLEYVYEYPPPMDATLCPGARQALAEGRCQNCPGRDERPSPHICPLGFWCTSRILERHSHDRNDPLPLRPSEFRILSDPSAERNELTPLHSAGFAASDRVDSAEPGSNASASAFKALGERVGRAFRSQTWDDWRTSAMEVAPSLIVLLPHTISQFDLPAMEIGDGEVLNRQNLTPSHLGMRQGGMPPIVLLLGCETQEIDIPFQGLVAKFRREGAAIVVSTLTPVLGRHAAPVAATFVDLLASTVDAGGTPLGEVIRRLRLRALAEGQAAVLCLFADGDADWRLVPDSAPASAPGIAPVVKGAEDP